MFVSKVNFQSIFPIKNNISFGYKAPKRYDNYEPGKPRQGYGYGYSYGYGDIMRYKRPPSYQSMYDWQYRGNRCRPYNHNGGYFYNNFDYNFRDKKHKKY